MFTDWWQRLRCMLGFHYAPVIVEEDDGKGNGDYPSIFDTDICTRCGNWIE